ISGRPISFQMNIYQPLYVPRPTVEPELFASLRPPAYTGALGNTAQPGQPPVQGQGGQIGQVGGIQIGGGVQGGMIKPNFVGNSNRYQVNPGDNNALLLQNAPRLNYDDLQKRRQEQQAARANAKKVGGYLASLDPGQGVSSMASAEEVGEYH